VGFSPILAITLPGTNRGSPIELATTRESLTLDTVYIPSVLWDPVLVPVAAGRGEHDQLYPSRVEARCVRVRDPSLSPVMKTDNRPGVGPPVGKVRLQKWFVTQPSKVKQRIVRDVTQLVLARKPRQCNFLEYQGTVISFFPHWFSPTQTLRVPIHFRTNSVDPPRFEGDLPPLCLLVFRVWRDGR